MNNRKYTLDNIRHRAKKIKKECNITYTQALEIVAKKLGYSNWIHCHRSLSRRSHPEASDVSETSQIEFNDWLKRHKNRDSPLGDLAQEMLHDQTWPSYNSLVKYQEYFDTKSFRLGASAALGAAWKSYQRYLRQQSSTRGKIIKTNKEGIPVNKLPKIVSIKGVTAIHYKNRTVEKFIPGDSAWVSWDGRKAMPVTILEVDDTHYTFRVERPLKNAGSEHFLFLDEVRSTPELACMNHVTF